MTAQAPTCQLMARQDADYRGWLWVAPPRDSWLESGQGVVWSADLDVCDAWRGAGRDAIDTISPLPRRRLLGDVLDEVPNDEPDEVIGDVPGAVLFWPKSLALGEWWLAALNAVLPEGTPIQVVGENQGGIKRVPKILASLDQSCRKLDMARRCTLFASRTRASASNPEDAWQAFTAQGLKLVTHPGVFGHGKLDDGTRLLMETLTQSPIPAPKKTSFRTLDVGCGDGVLSAWLASQGFEMTAVDISAFAVEATRRTLIHNQLEGTVVQSDVYAGIAEPFEAIVSNPPFHQERSIDYGPAERLIREAPKYLVSGGSLTLVANTFLPYPDWLQAAFGGFEILADNRRFRVYRAIKTRR